MDDGYNWRETRGSAPIRLPGPDNLGWWAGVAFFVAVILHVAAFFALGHIKIAMGIAESPEISTRPMNVDQVEVLPDYVDQAPDEAQTPPPVTSSILEEIDLLAKLPDDVEMEMRPDMAEPQFDMAISNSALEGDPEGAVILPDSGFELDTALPELGRTPEPLPLAADSQTIIDPGVAMPDDTVINRFAADLMKKGAGGNSPVGTLDGVVTLDDMLGLPADVLVGKMTMLPSDLLFDYNSAELRESARVGMMKLALIIEKNPNLYCWIEGHSDLFGTDQYNLELSRRRAESVRKYLTGALFLPGDKIQTRGFGKTRPLVRQGSVEEQAGNRRVEIRMRKHPAPPQIQVKAETPAPPVQQPAPPPVARPVAEPRPPAAPPEMKPEAPVLVKPLRALPVEEDEVPPTPRAKPVEEPAEEKPAPRAKPVQEEPEEEAPRARPVTEEDAPREPLRAIPVE